MKLDTTLGQEYYLALRISSSGEISEYNGRFCIEQVLSCNNIDEVFSFYSFTANNLKVGDSALVEGVNHKYDLQNFTIDANITRISQDHFEIVVRDLTSNYAEQRELGQERNQLDILQHSLLQQNEQLIELKKKAEFSALQKTEFLANMSHEIRTPLNAILGFSDMLKQQELDNDSKRHVQNIYKAGESLLTILNDILDLSKIEAGKYEISNEKFFFHEQTQQSFDLMQHRASDQKIDFNISIDENIPQILIGDSIRYSQILTNLLSNASKFTSRGYISLHAELLEKTNKSCNIEISITDSGIGIPENKLEAIFNAFVQNHQDDARVRGGTGLGLAIVKRLIELMGGNIQVNSEVGVGSTFDVILPFELPSGAHLAAINEEKPTALGNAASLHGIRVLLVEDDVLNQEYAHDLLHTAGLEVSRANNGREAMTMIREHTYDVIMMDIRMPEMNGDEAIKIIRNDLPNSKKNVIIVVTSANAFENDVQNYLDLGANLHIAKPFTQDQLIDNLSALLSSKTLETQSIQSKSTVHDPRESAELVALYKQHTPDYVQTLLDAYQSDDIEGVKFQAHKLASAVAVMGYNDLQNKLLDIEHDKLVDQSLDEAIAEVVSDIMDTVSELGS